MSCTLSCGGLPPCRTCTVRKVRPEMKPRGSSCRRCMCLRARVVGSSVALLLAFASLVPCHSFTSHLPQLLTSRHAQVDHQAISVASLRLAAARPGQNSLRFHPRMSVEEQDDRVVFNLLQLCASTNRGQSATLDQRYEIENAISDLEFSNPTPDAAMSEALNGEWRLVYASESMTRSSPFFWGFRKAFDGVSQPLPLLPGDLSEALFAITDGLPFQRVGTVVQTITGAGTNGTGTLESSVEVTLRVFDALIPPQNGFVTTTSKFEADGPNSLRLTVQDTAVKRSTWAQLPVVGALVDGATFPTREAFERVRAGSSEVVMEVSYLSASLRIARNDNGQVFVFCRTDPDTLAFDDAEL